MFKVGDVVIITPPEDLREPPGLNDEMQEILEDNNFKMVLSGVAGRNGEYWGCMNDPGLWNWPEKWMKKVNKFKGNK